LTITRALLLMTFLRQRMFATGTVMREPCA